MKDRQYEVSILSSTKAAAELEGWKKGIKAGRQEGLEEGRAEGLEQGLAQGRRELLAVAQNLKRSGSSVDFIAEVTGLSVPEVDALE